MAGTASEGGAAAQHQPQGCPVAHDAASTASPCPVAHDARVGHPMLKGSPPQAPVNPANNMLLQERQLPAAGQTAPLSTFRVTSSIPKADFTPDHQMGASPVWEYPSEQMFYNAMKRKGWRPQENDMPSIVSIHNAVNERCWHQVLAWEELHKDSCCEPRLKRFQGRPKDLSPKARIWSLLGYEKPFDRHDWVVDRCGTEVRYVLDYYNATPRDGGQLGMYIDARPALDSFGAVADRVRMSFRNLLRAAGGPK